MVSKKVIAPALAGTGAAGASGTLAWTLSLFGGEENVGNSNESPDPSPSKHAEIKQKPSPRSTVKWTRNRPDFEKVASSDDKKVIDSESLIWEIKWNEGFGAITVHIKENDFLWRCRLKAVSIDGIKPYDWTIKSDYDAYSEFKRQTKVLEEKLKDESNKGWFVENCAKARSNEKKEESIIELKTEKVEKIFKFKESEGYFEGLWTGSFTGIDRLSEDDEGLLNVSSAGLWSIKEESGTKGKIKISSNKNELVCYISGTSDKSLSSKTFKDEDDKLEEILGFSLNSSEIEKKRYLIKNCRKNKMAITGMKIKVDKSNWWFEEESLKKISEEMYENPTTTT